MEEKYSYWEEIGGLFICKNCSHYVKEGTEKCPKCKSIMVGTQLEMELFEKKINN